MDVIIRIAGMVNMSITNREMKRNRKQKKSTASRRRHSAESYKVVVNNIYLTSDNYFTGCGGIICDDDSLDFQSKNAKSF